MAWRHRNNLIHGDHIIALNDHFSAQFAEVVDDVVRKGVVIIDNKDHCVALSRLNVVRE